MKLILVCGPWSSGTTVVSAMLDRLGARGLPPYFRTNDPRTPNSFESQAFRDVIAELVEEHTLRVRVERPAAQARLTEFAARLESEAGGAAAPLFLKYPPSALLIPEICAAFSTRLVYVLRPTAAIEATRTRRGWAPYLGAAGARVLYPWMFETLVEGAFPTLLVRYDELLADPPAHAAQMAQFCGLAVDAAQMAAAAAFVRARDAR